MKSSAPFKQLKMEVKTFYDNVGKVYCPALKAEVFFTSDGFHHLHYNSARSERNKSEQRNKLVLVKDAYEIIKVSTTFQEYRTILQPVGTQDKNGFKKMTKVELIGFWAVLGNTTGKYRVRVVVRRISENQYHFWSVSPFWVEKEVNGQKVKYMWRDDIIED